jgi:predicted nucleic acid-binding protein
MSSPTADYVIGASYVILGERLGLAIITADEKLILTLSGTTYKIQWLGNINS